MLKFEKLQVTSVTPIIVLLAVMINKIRWLLYVSVIKDVI